jgi:hypothetical protein
MELASKPRRNALLVKARKLREGRRVRLDLKVLDRGAAFLLPGLSKGGRVENFWTPTETPLFPR